MEKLSKTETKKEMDSFFSSVKSKTPKEIRKMKKLAMSQNIPMKELRKKFCKKCYSPDLKIKNLKNHTKKVECKNCGNLMRWKMKI